MLADVVRERRAEVLEYAGKRLAHVTRASPEIESREYLSLLLDLVVADLSDAAQKADDDVDIAASAGHYGRALERIGADMPRVVHAFGVICDSISEIAVRAGVMVAPSDWQKLNRALDLGIAQAIAAYEAVRIDQRRASAAELGSVAHELRNALAAASVAFEVVKRGRVGVHGRTADILTRNLKAAATLSNALVLQSKKRGRPKPVLEAVALRPTVEDVVSSEPAPSRITVEIDVAATLVVVADKDLLASALTNLVQNALKFTRPGGTVTVRAAELDDGLSIEVEDACGGLPPGKIEALFEPFVQEGKDRSGAGLGLMIVRDVMDAHGGRVGARDLPGKGCVFALVFPRGAAPQT
jgi:signal transduction histidine kinase